jgi:predicted dehydrogenase
MALRAGAHVWCEKPVAVSVKAARDLNEQWEKKYKHLKFVMMFQLRTMPIYAAVKKLIADGELGEISRITFYATDQFRTWAYYASGGWRATWKGEGGGVLLNQCPHYLDLLQWIPNMVPRRVTATATNAKTHPIEVEDEVTAYLEYANGATGVFVASTGEAPGTNRLEIAGEQGKLVYEGGKISFTRNETPTSVFMQTTRELFGKPDVWQVDVPIKGVAGQHQEITQNFCDAILDGTPLIAPAEEGINSVELANAMLYSSLIGQTVELPLDSAAFEKCLKELIANSRFVKKKAEQALAGSDFAKSFHH